MSKALLEKIRSGIVVFDIDGVLAAYEFGNSCHYAPVWEEAFVSDEDNPYVNVSPLPMLQNFISQMDMENVYVCSVAQDFERTAKADFVLRNYRIYRNHIIFVDKKDQKLDALCNIQKSAPGKSIAIVDDTVKTLDAIYKGSDFITVHITSFFD